MTRQAVSIRVLRELGVLFEPPQPPQAAQGPELPLDVSDHVFHRHAPLWQFEHPFYAYPFAEPDRKPVFETLPPETPLTQVLEKTKLVVFLGAADTPAFRRCLEAPGVFLLIYEPDAARLERFAAQVPAPRLAKKAAILHGDPFDFVPPMSAILPPQLFHMGFPVFYALPGLAAHLEPGAVDRFVEQVEILFFRHCVYPLSGQANQRNLPMRPLTRGLFYDQQLHAYENIADFVTRPDIRLLRKALPNETAILVAAGPNLPEQLDYLRRNRAHAVIIAVNNALKPLLAAGVRPHFVVANDTSIHTGRSWEGLARLNDIVLVGHALTDLGGEVFGQKFLFGSFMPEVFGNRPHLKLHGSVITTAFSLARHMGCTRCILAGVQLCSEDPWTLAYTRGSIHERPPTPEHPLTNAFPQLVPVTNKYGVTRYTSLNFLDASIWLLEEIRTSGIPCVNLTTESIVYGPGVEYEADPRIEPSGMLGKRLARVAVQRRTEPSPLNAALGVVQRELANWQAIERGVAAILGLAQPAFLGPASQALVQFDANSVSYLVQRYEEFDNRLLHANFFEGASDAEKEDGLRYYLDHVRRMAATFGATLSRQAAALGVLKAHPQAQLHS